MRAIRGVMIIVALLSWVLFIYALCLGGAESAFDYALWGIMFTTLTWLTHYEPA